MAAHGRNKCPRPQHGLPKEPVMGDNAIIGEFSMTDRLVLVYVDFPTTEYSHKMVVSLLTTPTHGLDKCPQPRFGLSTLAIKGQDYNRQVFDEKLTIFFPSGPISTDFPPTEYARTWPLQEPMALTWSPNGGNHKGKATIDEFSMRNRQSVTSWGLFFPNFPLPSMPAHGHGKCQQPRPSLLTASVIGAML
ncbi:hypothetical protein K2173_012329 [Erythroxylum novogranatense]|uniref:Uncharacterized protein n=1 Tax=Erythroxylum novogranatense TaxID=1862640 RepID=A0AAV8SCL6_9ROSI|nr:hypothetical protein K2173_012329 [Erythroxylum novogranatense]